MIHFIYFLLFGLLVAVVFAAFYSGDFKKRALHGLRVFAEFIGIGMLLAWVFYFIPW
jgi:hypothetical protein